MAGQPYEHDAIVVGSGPNGLAAAITLAKAGLSVLVVEGAPVAGGGMRSAELILPGFVHDICSSVDSLAASSPFFKQLPLGDYGVEWAHPPLPLAHPFDDGTAAYLARSVDETADSLGCDGPAYHRLMGPLVAGWPELSDVVLAPPLRIPRHPVALARFGLKALRPVPNLLDHADILGERARGLMAGLSAHSMLPLDMPMSAAFGLVLGASGHTVGWPVTRGGSQSLADAMVAYLRSLGGEIMTGMWVTSLAQLPPARAVLCDVTPRQLLQLGGELLPPRYRRALQRYRYGVGIFKLDWALDGPIPWRSNACRRAGTVHLGATLSEIAESERAAWEGRHVQRPYVILVQQSVADPTRAPANKHVAWGYCHVPHDSRVDVTEAIEGQVERFAPGFRDSVLGRRAWSIVELERHNPNYVGGDINGGVQDFRQFLGRPVLSPDPYATPVRGLYLCSSSTPPGGGVHGMCGYYAAWSALRRL
jgi:phytoene dehydrogenase-like protein